MWGTKFRREVLFEAALFGAFVGGTIPPFIWYFQGGGSIGKALVAAGLLYLLGDRVSQWLAKRISQ